MKSRWLFALLPMLTLNLPAAYAQTIEPGLWEIKQDIRTPDRPEMAAQMAQMREQMKNLPPQARKQMEQQMASMGVGLNPDGAIRNCVSPEEARQDVIREGDKKDDCTYTKVSRTGNVWRGRMVCTNPPSQGDFTTTLHDRKHYTTEAVITGQDKGRPTRMEMKMDARFVSADCGALAKRPARK
ncbi:MAG TPA: DUF3617 domain-containing protein [Ottowia sp.]|jgi:hypothetical protein|nr:DUF3617 domain-containing protein [Ottowia sp.]HMT82613.1 DUF3617 domain-containing protein [Ottowia sp.]HOK12903.1 DUF3617 domain-containing protein [Ottowia sp.]HOM21303.1 DUF3617 domain-containing protein [Ottowia sp.]HON29833.1 DUF3617 domain-containing protein [Ottowia sp.]